MKSRSPREQQLYDQFGLREPGTALFEPDEVGYRCPEGHADITWSEYNEHIWCYKCQFEYWFADCLMVQDKCNPAGLPEQMLIVREIKNWSDDGTDTIDIPKEVLAKLPRKVVPLLP